MSQARRGPEVPVPSIASERERELRRRFLDLFARRPLPEPALLANLGLFVNRQLLSKFLFLNELYQKILPIHGIVVECGTLWGQDLALFASFRGIYEPYNYTRKIVGFDTFAGVPALDEKDAGSRLLTPGVWSLPTGYETYLEAVLDYHEQESPIAHLRKHEIVKGDASVTVPAYLREHPETIIALAYLDLGVYAPTRTCLEAIRDHVTRGSIVAVNPLNSAEFPGVTLALREVFGLSQVRIARSALASYQAYFVIE